MPDIERVTASGAIRPLRDERGFTLIEILAAMMVLLVGVLGVVSMIDGANAITSVTKGREGATNLARELIETSRSVDYDKVTTSALPGQLQAKPGLSDASGAAGWQLRRRGIDYTIETTACTFDDAADNTAPHDASFCSNSATTPPGDTNPDDYRRVTFDVTWKDRNRPHIVSQSALITNPSGGLGPTISSFTQSGSNPVTSSAQTTVSFAVTSSPADAVRWSADDGNSDGDASGGPTSWNFTWTIGTVGSFSCGTAPAWTLDGDYIITVQAFDSRGIPGDLRTKTVTLDRSAPAPPCGLSGGRNGSVVDLQWLPNAERDIAGYRVFRLKLGSESADPEVCSLTAKTYCHDPSPPDPSTYPDVEYYVVAYDSSRSAKSSNLSVAQTGNTAPDPPSNLSASFVDGLPTLSWTAATDPDGSIQFYRIYRDGVGLSSRYDATGDPALSWTDNDEQAGHNYWVTAVDDKFAESSPVGPVSP